MIQPCIISGLGGTGHSVALATWWNLKMRHSDDIFRVVKPVVIDTDIHYDPRKRIPKPMEDPGDLPPGSVIYLDVPDKSFEMEDFLDLGCYVPAETWSHLLKDAGTGTVPSVVRTAFELKRKDIVRKLGGMIDDILEGVKHLREKGRYTGSAEIAVFMFFGMYGGCGTGLVEPFEDAVMETFDARGKTPNILLFGLLPGRIEAPDAKKALANAGFNLRRLQAGQFGGLSFYRRDGK